MSDFYVKYKDLFDEIELVEKMSGNFNFKVQTMGAENDVETEGYLVIKFDGTLRDRIELADYSDGGFIQVWLPTEDRKNKIKECRLRSQSIYTSEFINIPVGEFKRFMLETFAGYGGEALESVLV